MLYILGNTHQSFYERGKMMESKIYEETLNYKTSNDVSDMVYYGPNLLRKLFSDLHIIECGVQARYDRTEQCESPKN